MTRFLQMLLGALLLLLVLCLDAAAINRLFGYGTMLIAVSLLVLECLFVLCDHYRSQTQARKVSPLAQWNRRFHGLFLVLNLCCVTVFAADGLAVMQDYQPFAQVVFWVLFAGLVMVGVGIALSVLAGTPEGVATERVATGIRYGGAGYS